jgi:hypothetical protein
MSAAASMGRRSRGPCAVFSEAQEVLHRAARKTSRCEHLAEFFLRLARGAGHREQGFLVDSGLLGRGVNSLLDIVHDPLESERVLSGLRYSIANRCRAKEAPGHCHKASACGAGRLRSEADLMGMALRSEGG